MVLKMMKHNVYFVEKKISLLAKIIGYMGENDAIRDPDIKMYVPDKFVLGPFKKRSTGLVLQVERMAYDNSTETLDKYQEAFKKEDLEVIKSGNMPESELENFSAQAREHSKTKKMYYKSKDDMVKSMDVIMEYLKI